MLFSIPRIIQHSYNFFSSNPNSEFCYLHRIYSFWLPPTPNPKLLTEKLEGTGTNSRPRIRPLVSFSIPTHKLTKIFICQDIHITFASSRAWVWISSTESNNCITIIELHPGKKHTQHFFIVQPLRIWPSPTFMVEYGLLNLITIYK